jgi:hypothetical protein
MQGMKETPWLCVFGGLVLGALVMAMVPKHRPTPDQYEDALNAYFHAQADLDAALERASTSSDSAKVRRAVDDARDAMQKAKAAAKRTDLVVSQMFEETGRYEPDNQPRPWEGGRP